MGQGEANGAGRVATGQIVLAQEMPNKRNLTISLYLLEGEDDDSVNKRLDLIVDIAERQRARLEIPLLEAALLADKNMLVQWLDMHNELLNKQKDGKRLKPGEESKVVNGQKSIDALKDKIARGESMIEETRAKAV